MLFYNFYQDFHSNFLLNSRFARTARNAFHRVSIWEFNYSQFSLTETDINQLLFSCFFNKKTITPKLQKCLWQQHFTFSPFFLHSQWRTNFLSSNTWFQLFWSWLLKTFRTRESTCCRVARDPAPLDFGQNPVQPPGFMHNFRSKKTIQPAWIFILTKNP